MDTDVKVAVGMLIVLGLAVVGFSVYGLIELFYRTPKRKILILSANYDIKDVDVFLSSVGQDRQAFIDSISLRKQYEVFKQGKTTDFIQQAMASRKSSDSSTSGMVTGIVIGSSINSGGA